MRGLEVAMLSVLGLFTIIAAPVGVILENYFLGTDWGPSRPWIDIVRSYLRITLGGGFFVGAFAYVPFVALVYSIYNPRSKYSPQTARLRWQVALVSPATAAIPAIVMGAVASVALACAQGNRAATGPAWMGSSVVLWTAVSALPALYAWVFVIGFRRAWREAPTLTIASDRCSGCGYSRAGLPLRAPCPECGTRDF